VLELWSDGKPKVQEISIVPPALYRFKKLLIKIFWLI
jgi:hypothetical protein